MNSIYGRFLMAASMVYYFFGKNYRSSYPFKALP